MLGYNCHEIFGAFPTIAHTNKNNPTICITIVLTIKNISKISLTIAHAIEYFPTISLTMPYNRPLRFTKEIHGKCGDISEYGIHGVEVFGGL